MLVESMSVAEQPIPGLSGPRQGDSRTAGSRYSWFNRFMAKTSDVVPMSRGQLAIAGCLHLVGSGSDAIPMRDHQATNTEAEDQFGGVTGFDTSDGSV